MSINSNFFLTIDFFQNILNFIITFYNENFYIIFGLINNIDNYIILGLDIAFLGLLIHFSGKGKIIKEGLDITAKAIGIAAGSTILYKNWIEGGGSSSQDDDKNKDDKNKDDKNKDDKKVDNKKDDNSSNDK